MSLCDCTAPAQDRQKEEKEGKFPRTELSADLFLYSEEKGLNVFANFLLEVEK